MNVSYKREMRHNYLILEAKEEKEESFEIRMLTENSIEGLLKFRIKQEEMGRYYCYEITSKQPLSRLLEFKEIKKEELSRLIMEIGAVLKRIEDYLLSESNLFLEPDHIYIEPESYQVWLCYIPGYEKSFPEAMEKFLQYLLKKTNHKDNGTVVLAYRLYQESQKDYYGIEDLLRIVRENQQERLGEITEASKKDLMEESWIESGEFSEEIGKKEKQGKQKRGKKTWEKQNQGKQTMEKQNRGSSDWEKQIQGNFNQDSQKGKRKNENSIRKEQEEADRQRAADDRPKKMGLHVFAVILGIFILGPLLVWLYAGRAGLRIWQYQIGLLSADIGAVFGGVLYLWKKKKRGYLGEFSEGEREKRAAKELEAIQKESEWQMTFEEDFAIGGEEKEEFENSREGIFWENKDDLMIAGKEAEDTVLLAEVALQNEQKHQLKSVNPSVPDIAIPYFPFIIGKQEGIVDYVLKKDTISRIHLRIDEEDGNCKVTDLNSSNGTIVEDYRLEANESHALCSGDKLIIADISFIFY